MAESKTRPWKTDLILRYEATSAEENPLSEAPTTAVEVPSPAEGGLPTATTKAEVPLDKVAATTEDKDPAVAVQVGVSVTASDAEGSPVETPGAARVGETPTAKEDEAPAAETVAGNRLVRSLLLLRTG